MTSPMISGTLIGETTTTSRESTTSPAATMSGMSVGRRRLTTTTTSAPHRARNRKIESAAATRTSVGNMAISLARA